MNMFRKILLVIVAVFSVGVLTLIPQDFEDYLDGLSYDQISDELFQQKGLVYAKQINQKKEAINDKIEIDLGILTSSLPALLTKTYIKGDSISSSELNDTIDLYVQIVQSADNSVIPSPVLSQDFSERGIVVSDDINIKFTAIVNLIDSASLLPDKIVLSGETWNVAAGSVNKYKNIEIQSGGIVNITGSEITVLQATSVFINNGTIQGYSNSLGKSLDYEGSTYLDNRVSTSNGSGNAALDGSSGNNGISLLIKSPSLSGTGSIIADGYSGINGSNGETTQSCPSNTIAKLCSDKAGGDDLLKCEDNLVICSPLGNCDTLALFTPVNNRSNNHYYAMEALNKLLISDALAISAPPECNYTDPSSQTQQGGGGGSGGSGGIVWIEAQTDTSSMTISLLGGSGGSGGSTGGGSGQSGSLGTLTINDIIQ